MIFQGMCKSSVIGDTWGRLQEDAVRKEIKSSSPIDWKNHWMEVHTILDEIYEKQREFLDEWAKHERHPYLRGKMVEFLGLDFPFESK